MDIPGHLEAQIRDGKAVLFVGAGGSMEAKDKNGARPPNAGEFAAMLSERFLGGKYKGLPLAEVSEYAISEADLVTVQEFIREMFEGFEPSTAHQLIPSFNWWGLATTNFDRLIEKAYEQSSNPVQLARPFIENGDRVEDHMRDPRSVMLLKLHGCITRTSNTRCPLILTPDQYVLHRQGRSRLFDHLRGWSFERPIVFVGHRLQDSDLRTILLELTNTTDSRPRFYAVLPEVDPIQQRLWEAKKVTLLQGKLVDFLTSLDSRIPRTARVVTADSERPQLAIAARFKKTDATLSEGCLQFLRTDVDYVGDISATRMIAPADFYKGMNAGWAPIEQELDVRRQLGDTILADHVLIPESGHPRGPEFILVKAHAGAGKSVLLRRIAWDASKDYGALCLFLKPHGVINSAALQELITACQERVYLFVDEGADRVRELEGLASNIGPEGDRLTVVLAERINEWNIAAGGELSSLMSATYELRYLSPREIDTLLGLLEKHRALGTLERASIDARRAAFVDRAGRQLLVALHEATLGKPFEEIIENEFKNVRPVEAQRMYLSICVLNRLNVPVRAGIIARIHDVHFEEFKEKFFGPLEQVVYADYDPIIRDYMYRARHPHIADIVFQKVLRNQEERFDVYVRCLKELNIDYSADSRAFRQMIRGRTVLDLFPDHELARRVYDVARERVGEEAHLLHQMGLYEMNRANGSLIQTADLLARAAVLAPWDLSIKHSMAEERLKSAEIARTSLQKESLLREAAEISMSLKSRRTNHTFGHHTLVKIGLVRLRDALQRERPAAGDTEIEQIVKEIERNLSDGLQRFPGDSYLLDSEAQLAKELNDSPRMFESLQRAFAANARNSFAAVRLAQFHTGTGEADKARTVLEKAIDANPSDRRLHFEYARWLLKSGNASGDELAYHLQRSFTPGDSNYTAQLLYARQLFLNGDRDGSRALFRTLGAAHVSAEFKEELLYPLDQRFRGGVARMEATHCFVARDGLADWIFVHRDNVGEEGWRGLGVGARLTFRIAFTLRGASGFDVQKEN